MGLTRPFRGAGAPASALSSLVLAWVLVLAPAAAGRAGAPVDPSTSDASPSRPVGLGLLALGGFDPVSYFLEGGPLPGSARHELSWGGRVWRFHGPADQAAFRDAPAAYAPRLGGYDAVGVLDGRLVDADPLVFAVVEGRLYLFRDAGRRERFVAEPDLARRAEAAWPALRGLLDAPPAEGTP